MPDRKPQILKSTTDLAPEDIRAMYDSFDAPVTAFDCGTKCAPFNPSGKPFCCDICHAVPAAYKSEWKYLEQATDLWHKWRGDECESSAPGEVARLQADIPKTMLLLACLGPVCCQREHRALSCRQFPFFPYVSSDYRFLGLTYEWEFAATCWVMSNLTSVTPAYREEFVRAYDRLFAFFQEEFEHYAYHSELMRAQFLERQKRFPLLHRNGGYYLVSPGSGRLERAQAERLPRFGYYKYDK